MPTRVSNDNLLIAALIVLSISSVGLKAAGGPVNDGETDTRPAQLETQLARTLKAQGFSTAVRPARVQSAIVYGARGACRVSVRDARFGTAVEVVFARDAAGIGPVRYLYRGQSSESAPAIAMRIGRLETEFLNRIGAQPRIAIPVALAASTACGGQTFGLDDVRLTQ